MKAKISAFLNELILYDYILFGAVFTLFLLFILLAIVKRKKVGLALFFLFFSFLILIVGSSVGYIQMHNYLFKKTLVIISQKKLSFTEAVVVKGTLLNASKRDFQECIITASALKTSKNPLKKYILQWKPFQHMSILEEGIAQGELREFKIIIEPFTYSKNYSISLGAKCK